MTVTNTTDMALLKKGLFSRGVLHETKT